MAFPSSPTNGQIVNVNNINYVYNSTTNSWTIVPASSAATISTFNTTANGTTLTYDLGFNPKTANAIFVTIDGIVQPESSYSVNTSANTITFDVEPINGENVRVVGFATINPYVIEDQSINPDKFSVTTNNYISTAASDAAIALSIALG